MEVRGRGRTIASVCEGEGGGVLHAQLDQHKQTRYHENFAMEKRIYAVRCDEGKGEEPRNENDTFNFQP